jgi:23S rRNA pseudouridine1911/1915/1917 synthase
VAQRTVKVPPELAGPLDRAVRALGGASWGRARGWIGSGKVSVAGGVVLDPTCRVGAGAEIRIDEGAPRPKTGRLADSDIVHVDAQVIVVAKPAGVSTVPFDDQESDTLDARVRAWIERRRLGPSKSGRGRGRPSLGVVHRLDRETSGLIVFTRTWLAKQSLAAQFRRHTAHRVYLALAHGLVASRTIRSWLVENRGDGLRGSARGAPPGPPGAREAITHVEALGAPGAATFTMLACRLETGRTHQIRIHLSEAGHPLVGERVYVRGFEGPVLEAPRLMLHASELGFVHPTTEREMRWTSPMPDDMVAVVQKLRAAGGKDVRLAVPGRGPEPATRVRRGRPERMD